MKALLIPVSLNEPIEIIEIPDSESLNEQVAKIHNLVEGYFEGIRLGDYHSGLINEEGKLHDLPINERASCLYPWDLIVGPMVVVSIVNKRGEFDSDYHDVDNRKDEYMKICSIVGFDPDTDE